MSKLKPISIEHLIAKYTKSMRYGTKECLLYREAEATKAYLEELVARRAQPDNEELNEAFDLWYQTCLHDNKGMTWGTAEELQRYRSRAQPDNEPPTLNELRGMDGPAGGEDPHWNVRSGAMRPGDEDMRPGIKKKTAPEWGGIEESINHLLGCPNLYA